MKAIKFKGYNAIYAKYQDEYKDLPAHKSNDHRGVVTTCWKMSFFERLKILFDGKIYLQIMTYNQPLQPLLLSVSPLLPSDMEESEESSSSSDMEESEESSSSSDIGTKSYPGNS